MSRLDREPAVIELAGQLRLAASAAPVPAVLAHCHGKVARWVAESGGVQGITGVERVVAQRLGLTFEDVWSDADLEGVVRKYVARKEGVFAYLRMDLDGTTYGATYRRRSAGPDSLDRYVAVIDCRGDKGARRFFTRWHEVAHLLTLTAELDGPVKRSGRDPIERLMDEIAGHVGFFEPIFGPIFDAQVRGKNRLTFEAVEAVRTLGFPDASFQSTLCACNRRFPRPLIYVDAAPAHKAEDQREMDGGQGWLFRGDEPVAVLRAVEVVPNPAAQAAGFFIAPNMRIPEGSVIHQSFRSGETGRGRVGVENLDTWEHSGGKRLANQQVVIEARKAKDRVLAIVQPAQGH